MKKKADMKKISQEATQIRVTRDTRDKLGVLAEFYGTTMSDLVRQWSTKEYEAVSQVAGAFNCDAFISKLEELAFAEPRTEQEYNFAIRSMVIIVVSAAENAVMMAESKGFGKYSEAAVLDKCVEIVNGMEWKDKQAKADVIDFILKNGSPAVG